VPSLRQCLESCRVYYGQEACAEALSGVSIAEMEREKMKPQKCKECWHNFSDHWESKEAKDGWMCMAPMCHCHIDHGPLAKKNGWEK
jgi:hypothetical protein